jgi:hypothetical protein
MEKKKEKVRSALRIVSKEAAAVRKKMRKKTMKRRRNRTKRN